MRTDFVREQSPPPGTSSKTAFVLFGCWGNVCYPCAYGPPVLVTAALVCVGAIFHAKARVARCLPLSAIIACAGRTLSGQFSSMIPLEGGLGGEGEAGVPRARG